MDHSCDFFPLYIFSIDFFACDFNVCDFITWIRSSAPHLLLGDRPLSWFFRETAMSHERGPYVAHRACTKEPRLWPVALWGLRTIVFFCFVFWSTECGAQVKSGASVKRGARSSCYICY